MSLNIICYAEDVAMGKRVKSIPMTKVEWEFFIFWLNVYKRYYGNL
ncbi:hypothetical protein XCR1_360001 [Xenorhabdus cabanillasii JM26]|uniref:Uncharacterized protein n=1 Tax=Xenorhabdus cabanillasii JM26 TaxID=1427517 RepID=W1JAE2_9GAMM|nr:hypothetical protein Xcab_04013 [Xenorhabdus cabanillasii JM26]CDL86445.1 hypothetical protein XCR1_360001 [Xenorhabdus cabanillasii JM26]